MDRGDMVFELLPERCMGKIGTVLSKRETARKLMWGNEKAIVKFI
jgi:hypothetical protein